MAELLFILEEDARRVLARRRLFLDRRNPLEIFDDVALIRKYRFPKLSILELIDYCKPHLERRTNRNHALPVHSQVLAALRFYAKGTFQEDTGDIVGISQPCVSRAIAQVSEILAQKASSVIKFPTSPDEIQETMQGMASIAGFPRVIGLIDGTHIRIRGPAKDEPLFICRKGGHSINTQIICDHNMMFTGVVAKYGGSTNDAFIWKFCSQRNQFVNAPPLGHILGGYALEPWLLTPLAEPRTGNEMKYNVAHKKTRNKIECAIGLWKSVFRCVDLSGGYLQYSPSKICRLLIATAVLHNMRRKLRLPEDEVFSVEPEDDDEENICPSNLLDPAITVEARNIRSRLITSYFN